MLEAETFKIGDVVTRHIYGRLHGSAEPVLLLAPGQRIETELQLKRLRDAGYSVRMPSAPARNARSEPSRPAAEPEQPRPVRSARAQPSFSERLEAAERLRRALSDASRDLLRRVDAGQAPDFVTMVSVGTMIVGEVAADPFGVAALTHLRQCDDYTVEHSADVSILMVAIGRLEGLSESELRLLAMAGLSHDLGKQRLPREVLAKTGPLGPDEWQTMRTHPGAGFEILAEAGDFPESVLLVARQHHERLDGGGYPLGLSGDAIHPHARIAAVANAFDSLTTDRPFRRGIPARRALLQIYTEAGSHFDPVAVAMLIKLVGVYPVGSRVHLNTGESGVVVAPNPDDTTKPMVQIDQDHRGRPLRCPLWVDLRDAEYAIVGTEN